MVQLPTFRPFFHTLNSTAMFEHEYLQEKPDLFFCIKILEFVIWDKYFKKCVLMGKLKCKKNSNSPVKSHI